MLACKSYGQRVRDQWSFSKVVEYLAVMQALAFFRIKAGRSFMSIQYHNLCLASMSGTQGEPHEVAISCAVNCLGLETCTPMLGTMKGKIAYISIQLRMLKTGIDELSGTRRSGWKVVLCARPISLSGCRSRVTS